jgi:hypothetical protein
MWLERQLLTQLKPTKIEGMGAKCIRIYAYILADLGAEMERIVSLQVD